jgi:hypothetical protein
VFVPLTTSFSRAMTAGSKKTATRNKRETEKKDDVEQKTGRVSFEMLQTQDCTGRVAEVGENGNLATNAKTCEKQVGHAGTIQGSTGLAAPAKANAETWVLTFDFLPKLLRGGLQLAPDVR